MRSSRARRTYNYRRREYQRPRWKPLRRKQKPWKQVRHVLLHITTLVDLLPRVELAQAKATLESQTSHIATLERDLADAELRLGSGEYNTKIWRCVEFADNPAARDHAIRKETLEKLRGENGALVERIKELEGRVGAGVNTGGEGHGMVPRETYERLKDEFEEKERGHEKRLQRLKEASSA